MPSISEDAESMISHSLFVGMHKVQPLWKAVWQFLTKPKVLPYKSAIAEFSQLIWKLMSMWKLHATVESSFIHN